MNCVVEPFVAVFGLACQMNSQMTRPGIDSMRRSCEGKRPPSFYGCFEDTQVFPMDETMGRDRTISTSPS